MGYLTEWSLIGWVTGRMGHCMVGWVTGQMGHWPDGSLIGWVTGRMGYLWDRSVVSVWANCWLSQLFDKSTGNDYRSLE